MEKDKRKNESSDKENTKAIITLKSNRKNYIIPLENIIYIEAMGNYVHYHTEDGNRITVYQSLKNCLDTLPGNFLRTHKSYIINSDKILSYDNDFIETTDGNKIPVGSSFTDLSKLNKDL
ncbi:MAG: LytTR family DNA-binding domain-containing protein [Cyclobacteriaceae bacterium]